MELFKKVKSAETGSCRYEFLERLYFFLVFLVSAILKWGLAQHRECYVGMFYESGPCSTKNLVSLSVLSSSVIMVSSVLYLTSKFTYYYYFFNFFIF